MKDRAPQYPGRVTLTPVEGQANTYDMVRADSPTQEGTALNKANLLTDATALAYGLTNEATPNDILNLLSRFQSGLGNECVWEKVKVNQIVHYDETVNSGNARLFNITNGNTLTVYYGSSYSVTDDLKVAIDNPTSVTFNYYSSSNDLSVLNGNWYTTGSSTSSAVTFIPSDSVITNTSGTMYSSGGNTRRSNFTYVDEILRYGYVNSPDESAYPSYDTLGEYTYLGPWRLGSNRVEHGYYYGTGTYGTDNRNMLTFSFQPKMLMIRRESSESTGDGIFLAIAGQKTTRVEFSTGSTAYGCGVSWDGTSVQWYSTAGVKYQMNDSNVKYVYVAIG